MVPQEKIGNIKDFPEGQGTKVEYNGIGIAVFNLNGELYGIQNSCPHKNLPLHLAGWDKIQTESDNVVEDCGGCERSKSNDGERGMIDKENKVVSCPWHLLDFDLNTGENEVTNVRIATYDLEVDDSNNVYLVL